MRSLRRVERTWNHLGRTDPMWAVLTNSREWDEEAFFATGVSEIARVMARLEELGLEVGRRRALDFGSGLGRLTRALAAHFDEVLGLDIAESMVARARELNAEFPGCEFALNRSPDLAALEDESFDFVYSYITLQHMPPDVASGYMAEFARVLRPGGAMVFQMPSKRRTGVDERGPMRSFLLRARAAAGLAVRLGRRHMEMHTMTPEGVAGVLAASGASLIDARPDGAGGRRWESRTYTAIKPAAGEA